MPSKKAITQANSPALTLLIFLVVSILETLRQPETKMLFILVLYNSIGDNYFFKSLVKYLKQLVSKVLKETPCI